MTGNRLGNTDLLVRTSGVLVKVLESTEPLHPLFQKVALVHRVIKSVTYFTSCQFLMRLAFLRQSLYVLCFCIVRYGKVLPIYHCQFAAAWPFVEKDMYSWLELTLNDCIIGCNFVWSFVNVLTSDYSYRASPTARGRNPVINYSLHLVLYCTVTKWSFVISNLNLTFLHTVLLFIVYSVQWYCFCFYLLFFLCGCDCFSFLTTVFLG